MKVLGFSAVLGQASAMLILGFGRVHLCSVRTYSGTITKGQPRKVASKGASSLQPALALDAGQDGPLWARVDLLIHLKL